MKITLLDVNPSMVAAWHAICSDLPNVEILQSSFHAFKGDAIVSPANSFGFMDGGADYKFSEHYGWDVQERLQQIIKNRFHGELPVGQATLVAMQSKGVRFLISAPTMRAPTILGDRTLNPYLATRAALIAAKQIEPEAESEDISICLTGMGTGVGMVPYTLCAHQMRCAIEQVVLGKTAFPNSWRAAADQTAELITERKW